MFRLDNAWGFTWAMHAMRLAYKSESDSSLSDNIIGPKDYKLAMNLIKLGPSHGKFLRTIVVWATIKAPRFWWLQWDTYNFKVDLSESTHHTILKRPLTQNDFVSPISPITLDYLNNLITSEKEDREIRWREVKINLPESFLQTRGVVTNYQTLRTAFHQRKVDPLDEWRKFEQWVMTLPYKEFITDFG